MKRLFVGIPLPASIRRELVHLRQPDWSATRWVQEEQFHLTLQFLGATELARIPSIIEALSGINIPSFSLHIMGTGVFPTLRRARVLWAGVQPSHLLHELQQTVSTRLQPLGYEPEKRPFHPHITLARFKGLPPQELAGFLQANHDFELPPFTVVHFHLYESRLQRQGATYHPLHTFPLMTP